MEKPRLLTLSVRLMFQKQLSEVFYKKAALKNFATFTGNTCVGVAITSLKRLQRRCFLVNIAKILRAPILNNICQRLLLMSI